jgi:hypothetical protein
MAITERKLEDQNPAQAPTLGMGAGTFGQQAQQRSNIAQGGSGRFTNLQQYIKANEANPNAQLLQREGTRRQEELGTRQGEFTRQAEPIKQQFEGIRSGQQFVQSALQDPTRVVQDPSQLQRFTQYRTQGIGDVEAPFQQLQTARGTLGTQQEQLASGLETIQRDPNALQNFIQSQRVNPALATRGENVLDRFLTQSTESGQKAIAGLGTTAGVIRGTQAPSIIQDVESLRTQAMQNPLTTEQIQSTIQQTLTPEEEYIKSIDRKYLADQLNLGKSPAEIETELRRFDLTEKRKNELIDELVGIDPNNPAATRMLKFPSFNIPNISLRPNLSTLAGAVGGAIASTNPWSAIGGAIAGQSQANALASQQAAIERERLSQLAAAESLRDEQQRQQRQQRINELVTQIGMQNEVLQPFQEGGEKFGLFGYEAGLGKTREQLLGQFEQDRLNRVKALQQLAGTDQFNPLLQTQLSSIPLEEQIRQPMKPSIERIRY